MRPDKKIGPGHCPGPFRARIYVKSEANRKVRLSLSCCIGLRVNHLSEVRIVEIQVWTAKNDAVEDVEVLHLELGFDVLPDEELLADGDILVGAGRVPQLTNHSWCVAQHPGTRIAEVGGVDNRQSLVHVVVRELDVLRGQEVCPVAWGAVVAQRIS